MAQAVGWIVSRPSKIWFVFPWCPLKPSNERHPQKKTDLFQALAILYFSCSERFNYAAPVEQLNSLLRVLCFAQVLVLKLPMMCSGPHFDPLARCTILHTDPVKQLQDLKHMRFSSLFEGKSPVLPWKELTVALTSIRTHRAIK